MEERSAITLAALEQRKQKRLRPVTEDPAEELGEEPAEEPAEEPVEEPPQALHTPAKEWNECDRVQFTDVMKLELLRVWIVKTENALIRASTSSGKAPFIKQRLPLLEEGVGIMVGVEKFRLISLAKADSLAQILQGIGKKGLSGQKMKPPGMGGLVHIIDEWLADKEDKSLEFVRSSCEEILDYARTSYC